MPSFNAPLKASVSFRRWSGRPRCQWYGSGAISLQQRQGSGDQSKVVKLSNTAGGNAVCTERPPPQVVAARRKP